MDNITKRLLTEAVVVGTGLLPVYYVTHKSISTAFKNLSAETSMYVSVFLSGAFFHLICEEAGVNEYYLTNSVAFSKINDITPTEWMEYSLDPQLCGGNCGWTDDGFCSHFSFHN